MRQAGGWMQWIVGWSTGSVSGGLLNQLVIGYRSTNYRCARQDGSCSSGWPNCFETNSSKCSRGMEMRDIGCTYWGAIEISTALAPFLPTSAFCRKVGNFDRPVRGWPKADRWLQKGGVQRELCGVYRRHETQCIYQKTAERKLLLASDQIVVPRVLDVDDNPVATKRVGMIRGLGVLQTPHSVSEGGCKGQWDPIRAAESTSTVIQWCFVISSLGLNMAISGVFHRCMTSSLARDRVIPERERQRSTMYPEPEGLNNKKRMLALRFSPKFYRRTKKTCRITVWTADLGGIEGSTWVSMIEPGTIYSNSLNADRMRWQGSLSLDWGKPVSEKAGK